MTNRLEVDTERLTLRTLTIADGPFLIELLNSEGWLANIGDRNARTQAEAETYLRNGPFNSYEQYGFGLSRVSLKATGQPIGLCGLLQRDYLDYPDIGYALLPQYWGKGYALEIARRTLEIGFTELALLKIQATVLPTNGPSIAVLQRLGMTDEGLITPPDSNSELRLFGKGAPTS